MNEEELDFEFDFKDNCYFNVCILISALCIFCFVASLFLGVKCLFYITCFNPERYRPEGIAFIVLSSVGGGFMITWLGCCITSCYIHRNALV